MHISVVPFRYIILLRILQITLCDSGPHQAIYNKDHLWRKELYPIGSFHALLSKLKFSLSYNAFKSGLHGLLCIFEPFLDLTSEYTISERY